MTFYVTDSEDGFGLTICPHCQRRIDGSGWCGRCGPSEVEAAEAVPAANVEPKQRDIPLHVRAAPTRK